MEKAEGILREKTERMEMRNADGALFVVPFFIHPRAEH